MSVCVCMCVVCVCVYACVTCNDLTWSAHMDKVVKAARKRLFFLRRLKTFGMDSAETGTARPYVVWSVLLSSSLAGSSQPYRTPTTHVASGKQADPRDCYHPS